MTERAVKIRLTAEVNSYLAGMEKVSKATRETSTEAKKLEAQLAAQRKMLTGMGMAFLAGGGAAAAGLTLATAKAAEFDKAMSAVEAATHAGVGEMRQLRDAALAVSQGTKFSATEAANAIEELSKAGVSTTAIINGGLKGALDLAAAGEMNVADAAGVAATTLGQFQLGGEKAAHVADVLAAGAGKAMGDVSDLSQALSQSGTVAAQFGISLDDTVGTLAAFASKGLLGSDAGTSFRTMLLRLANPSGQAAAEMKHLGIQAYDAGGKFVGMAGLAGQLEKGLHGLTQEQQNAALSIIFGQDAIRGANVLYTEGAKGIAEWTNKVNDTGYAADTASKRLDNLQGDLTKLKTSFDNTLIGLGESSQGPLRGLTQRITGLLNGFNSLPEPAKEAAFWVGAAGSAVAVAGGLALIAVPKVAQLRVALLELGVSSQRVTAGFGAMGTAVKAIPVAGAVIGLSQIGNQLADAALEATGAKKSVDGLTQSFKTLGTTGTVDDALKGAFGSDATGQLKSMTDFGFLSDLSNDLNGFMDSVRHLDFTSTTIDGTLNPLRQNLSQLDKTFAQMVASGNASQAADAFDYLASKTDGSKEAIGRLKGLLPEYSAALKDTKDASGGATSAARTAADAYQAEADKVSGVVQALNQLVDTMNAENDASQKAITANATWLDGLAGIKDAVKANGKSLDETTSKGAANAAMLAGLAGDAQAAAKAQYDVDQTTMSAKDASDKYARTLADQRMKFIDAATAAGFSKDAVKKLADEVFHIPSAKEIKMLVDTAPAEKEINSFIRSMSGRKVTLAVRANATAFNPRSGAAVFADGGYVRGPGTGRSDSILARLSNGEFISTARATAVPSNRRAMEYMNRGGVIQGYADGGYVQPTYAQPSFTMPTAGGGGTAVTVNQDIHPDYGRSAAEIARIAAEKVAFELRGA